MSIVACFFFVQSAQEVEFVPVATVMTDVHRYCLPVAFTARSSEMQLSMSGGQIVSCDLPLRTYGHTPIILIIYTRNYNLNIMNNDTTIILIIIMMLQ